ncbi:hypothetical protein [Luteolibacter luteus]|uniref:Uncharacterized protein n=1 Tax=Luteolibacter luteus TaxID=2728835 RepID=A0A858REY5_9BACT|nr:hypothetical protein [Luteolibacter luteus]QJE95656.1 hypothetical protein HHL09_07615 [Luteolibacter luteus]
MPGRKRGPARSIWLFLLLALVLLYGGPLRTEVNFVDDLGRLPPDFEVTLRSGGSEQKVIVSEGHLNLFRYRWQELDVSDLNYLRSIHPLRGREMNVTIERNSIRRLKDAASGLPSVPQRGDPDPKGERR